MGLDARNDFGLERKIVFDVDGPSLIRAELSNASARARVCLWQGNQVQNRQCDDIRNGVLERCDVWHGLVDLDAHPHQLFRDCGRHR